MKNQIVKSLLTSFAVLALLAPMTAAASSINYTFLEGNYVNYGNDIDADGLRIKGSVLLTPQLFSFAEYQALSDGPRDFDTANIGVGLRTALDRATELYGGLSLERQKVRVSRFGNSASGNGLGLRGGLRHRLNEQVELGGELRYVDVGGDIDDDYIGFTASLQYHLTTAVGLIAEFDNLDGDNGLRLGGRYNF